MTKIKERPILFSGPMVRALLDGRKTQTRRIVKPQPECYSHDDWPSYPAFCASFNDDGSICCGVCMGPQQRLTRKSVTGIRNPYGKPGDRLWVRETVAIREDVDPKEDLAKALHYIHYRANYKGDLRDEWHTYGGWKPSIFMPRWASRITLEVIEVRVQRLQDISDEDCIAEGIEPNWSGDLTKGWNGLGGEGWTPECGWWHYLNSIDGEPAYTPRESYQSLWESINGEGSWAANAWVWAISFKRI